MDSKSLKVATVLNGLKVFGLQTCDIAKLSQIKFAGNKNKLSLAVRIIQFTGRYFSGYFSVHFSDIFYRLLKGGFFSTENAKY